MPPLLPALAAAGAGIVSEPQPSAEARCAAVHAAWESYAAGCPVRPAHACHFPLRAPLRVEAAPGGGCRVVAADAIKAGTLLLGIDPAWQYTAASARARHPRIRAADAAGQFESSVDRDRFAIAAGLVLERRLGDRSPYAGYIAMLPPIGSADLWSAASLTEDENRCMHRSVANQRGKQLEQLRRYQAVWEGAGLPPGAEAELAWALLNVRTRSWRHGDTPTMVPFVDMLNHNPSQGLMTVYQPKSRGMQVLAFSGQSLAEGDEVFDSYGGMGPALALATYGFFDPNPTYVDPGVEGPCEGRDALVWVGPQAPPVVARYKADSQPVMVPNQPTKSLSECLLKEMFPLSPHRVAEEYLTARLRAAAAEYAALAADPQCVDAPGGSALATVRAMNVASARWLNGAADGREYSVLRRQPVVLVEQQQQLAASSSTRPELSSAERLLTFANVWARVRGSSGH